MRLVRSLKFPVTAALALLACVVCVFVGIAQQPVPPALDSMAIAPDRGAPGMMRWLRALGTRGSLLLVTAHPDDEDGGMLSYESRGKGARVGLLTLNRGEGGQDVMSSDMNDALGVVRTQELLAAGRYMGVEQYFTRVVDYGFSKTREEALEKWGHERVLADSVRVVRMMRPLVVASVFVGAPTDGHGNHQVAGQMAQEVYVAAGDPARFPEQIREGLRPWSPLKVYARTPFFTITEKGMYDYATDKYVPVRFFDYVNQKWFNTKPSVTLEIPEGSPAPAVGLTFVQIAREGLGLQKTQNGGGVTPPPGPQNTSYHRYGSRVPAEEHEKSFFDGIDVSVMGIASLASGDTGFLKAGLGRIAGVAADALREYSVERPSAVAPILAEGLKTTRELIAQVRASNLAQPGKDDVLFELGVKEQQFQKALEVGLDISLQTSVSQANVTEQAGSDAPRGRAAGAGSGRGGRGVIATGETPPPASGLGGPGRGGPGRGGSGPSFTIAIPEQSFAVEARMYNQTSEALNIEKMTLATSDDKDWNIHLDSPANREIAPGKQEQWRFMVTVPSGATLTRPYYTRPDEEQPYYNLIDERYRNLPVAPYPLVARARIAYKGVPFEVAQFVQTNEHVPGIGTLTNPLIVGPAISVSISPSAGAVPIGAKEFAFTATVHSNVKGPAQGTVRLQLPEGWTSRPAEAPFSLARDGEDHTLVFSIVPGRVAQEKYTIAAVAEYKGHEYREGYRMTGYPGIRPYPLYRPSTYSAVGVDVKTAPGLHIGFLPGTGDDVPKALENLEQNVRILAESDLTQGNLLGYDAIVLGVRAYAVRNDIRAANGRLLDYVKNGGVLIVQYNIQGFDGNYGPYPFSLGSNPEKVVDENSPVVLIDPSNPALGWPNKVTPDDFKGWVEERGHGFMSTWDNRYTPLIETHDPGQNPQKGGLLIARYGKGFYVYDAFALYRQLPAGVPGAYRLLANLVSLSKNPAWN